MVVALGEAYDKLDRLQEAKKCFWKAHALGDVEGMALIKLARYVIISSITLLPPRRVWLVSTIRTAAYKHVPLANFFVAFITSSLSTISTF